MPAAWLARRRPESFATFANETTSRMAYEWLPTGDESDWRAEASRLKVLLRLILNKARVRIVVLSVLTTKKTVLTDVNRSSCCDANVTAPPVHGIVDPCG
jgi:hypothetical protein